MLIGPKSAQPEASGVCVFQSLKWQFKTPRDELVDQLREQMGKNVSKTLISHMFHKDFKYHIVALTTLTQVNGLTLISP